MVQQFRAFKEKQCTKIASVNVFAFIIFFVLVSIYALINHPTELIEPLEEQWYLSGDSRYTKYLVTQRKYIKNDGKTIKGKTTKVATVLKAKKAVHWSNLKKIR